MKKALSLWAVLLLFSLPAWATRRYEARGLVLQVDKADGSLLVSCESIPGYMEAMTMSFRVRDPKELAGLNTGMMVEFTLVTEEASSYLEKIRIHRYESAEQDPLSARRLKLVADMLNGASPRRALRAGGHVPDFSLTDQTGQRVMLSQFSGKVVALTFTYTHCALPNFCFRVSNNFRQLQKRFAGRMGSDLILLTVTFDPVHDTPEVMAKYGKTWNADPRSWHLLTGSQAEVEDLCNRFGISFWNDEGLMTHSLHTFVLDRRGNIVANLEGNEFAANQLGDLVETVLSSAPEPVVQRASR